MAIVSYEYRINGGSPVSMGLPPIVSGQRQYSVTGLTGNTTYTFEERSVNTEGKRSPWSVPVICTTPMPAPLDLISSGTIIGAWGLRKLRNGYNGSAIRVSRSPFAPADEKDIGFDNFNNLDSATAIAWGSNLRIVKIYDQNGAVDLSPFGSNYALLNLHGSRPAIDFGGQTSNNIRYDSSATVNLTFPKEFLCFDYHHFDNARLTDYGVGNVFATYIDFSAILTQYNGANVSWGTINNIGSKQVTSWFQAGADAMRLNGANLTLVSGTDSGDTAAPAVTVHLGNYGGVATFGFSGYFYEKITIDGAVTTGDRTALEANQIAYYQKNKRLIGYGDSLTFGTGLSFLSQGYISQLQLLIPDGYDPYNLGVAGVTLAQLNTNIATNLAPFVLADATRNDIVLNGGFNDFNTGANAATIQSRFTTLATNIKALPGNIRLFVRPMPASNLSGQPAGYAAIRDIVNAWLATQVGTLFDGYADSTLDPHIGSASNTANTTYYQADQIHKTTAGYAAEVLYAVPLF